MKTNKVELHSDIPDFVEERDVLGLIKPIKMGFPKVPDKALKISVPELNADYAGLGERLNAFFIDFIILFSLVSVLDILTKSIPLSFSSILIQDIIIAFMIWIIYNGIFVSSKYQTTIGGILLKIKVVDKYGNRLSVIKAISRSIIALIAIVPLGFGIFIIAKDPKKQGWHDKWVDSFVVKI